MVLRSLVALSLTASFLLAQEPPHHLVQVRVPDAAAMDRLVRLDFDLAACTAHEVHRKIVEVIATDQDLLRLRQHDFSFEVEIRNLEEHYAAELARFGPFDQETLTPPLGQGAMGGHYTLAQMEAILDSFAQNHPSICAQKVSIGQTIQGRSIWMVKISDNVHQQENEPEVLYTGLHHAREPLSMSATLLFMDELLDGYGTDPEATFLVDNRQLYFIPCVNPDGYEYNRQTNPGGGGMWRKNRRNNGDGTFGVDLNRNYATGWSAPNGGNSTNTSSQTYRGTAPFSEPETQAIEAFANAHSFVQVMDSHTYTDVLLRPWGYLVGSPTNAAVYNAVGDRMTAENGVAHGSISQLLYIAAGNSVDHHHVVHGSLAWTPELGRSSEGGFWPNPVNTVNIARRHQPMFRAMALTAGAYLDIDSVTVGEAPGGGNGNGAVEPGEIGQVVATVQNRGVLAAAAPVTLTLTAVTAGVSTGATNQVNLTPPGALAGTSNATTPLTFSIPAGFGQPIAELNLNLTGAGRSVDVPVRVLLVPMRIAVDDDMEVDRGFARGATTATTGAWERSTPQQTTSGGQIIQPGFQHTPGGSRCWITDGRAGSSAGTFDVDGGYTDLLTPELDLSHLAVAELRLYRWYGESRQNDPFQAFLSRDGGQSWELLLSDPNPTGAWVEWRQEIDPPLTDRMRFRFRAQDLNASLVEAGIDDFAIAGVTAEGNMTLLGSGRIGTSVRVGMNAPAGSTAFAMLSPATIPGMTIPGVGGSLRLLPAGVLALPGTVMPAGGYAARDVAIPNSGSLVGLRYFWQGVYLDAGAFTFGDNVQELVLR